MNKVSVLEGADGSPPFLKPSASEVYIREAYLHPLFRREFEVTKPRFLPVVY